MNAWRALHARPVLADAALALVLAAATLASLFVHNDVPGHDYRDANAVAVLLALAMTVPLAARRRAPVLTFLVVIPAAFCYDAANFPESTGALAGLVAAYSLAVHASAPWRGRVVV